MRTQISNNRLEIITKCNILEKIVNIFNNILQSIQKFVYLSVDIFLSLPLSQQY